MDKWLVYARFVKHRSTATELVENGLVRLNSQRITKPAHALKPGDILTLNLPREVRVIRVLGEAEKRGPATQAQQLYEDLAPQPSHASAPENLGA
ncbi:RNA-binding S4 domain-containing protein [Aestuariivirga litoralis]|uniref:RNA-binding S4 domain-containing protein n=1 Tax=Aestuariivirga litoralis TaxID=2650924 RepID=UPI0024856370|nr:RNA-binding S4 domain-containing protein [Aestuariivirga litoralis]